MPIRKKVAAGDKVATPPAWRRSRSRPKVDPEPVTKLSSKSPPAAADKGKIVTTKRGKPIAPSNLDENGDYIIGKDRPPVAHQWSKGQSGNPKGKKKGTKNMDTEVLELFDTMITVQTSKGPETMPQGRALLRKIYEKAMKGDLKASVKLLELQREAHQRRAKASGEDEDALSEAEQAMLDILLSALSTNDDEEPDDNRDDDLSGDVDDHDEAEDGDAA